VRRQLEENTPSWRQRDAMDCIRCKENRSPVRHPYFRAFYEPLRQTSLALLRNEGASFYAQGQEAEGVVFDGSWLWEQYLWTLLSQIDGFDHPRNDKQRGRWWTEPGVMFYPDFFHRGKRVVLDAKYQRPLACQDRERRKQITKQVFTYMFLLDAAHGGLINPEGNHGSPPREITRQSGEHNQVLGDQCPQKALWHDLVLKAPQDETSAVAFKTEMKKREGAFKEDVKKILG
jgi:5-methylcytosine-specific restriction endonuclease McrBC regulatory subunit McrC